MIALAIDTSGDEATVALVRDEPGAAAGEPRRREVLGGEVLATGMRHGVELFPALERIFRGAGVSPRDVDLVAVGTGPGSYTGLRVGITAARAFAYAASADLLGVPSCDAWAAATATDGRPLAVVLDARIRAVYVAVYESENGTWARRFGPELSDPALAAARIPHDAVVVGDGAGAYAESFPGRSPSPTPARAEAAQIARLALDRLGRGEHDAIESVVPLYLRRPEAEIKREARTHD